MSSKIISWKKGEDLPLTKNFSTAEFSCHCSHPECVSQMIEEDLVNKLQQLRDTVKTSITVTSGYRCAAHQLSLREGGIQTAKGQSSHELGKAVDIQSRDMKTLEKKADKLFDNIGVAKSFIHVDTREPAIPGGKRRWKYA